MLPESIGLGILFSFLSGELLGITAGGLVSPGYLAYFLGQPLRIAATLALSLAIYGALRGLTKLVILFGRRRFMAAILLSLAGTWLVEILLFKQGFLPRDLRSIGYVIPGLIANDMYRQGVWKTLAATALAAALVRLLLFALAM